MENPSSPLLMEAHKMGAASGFNALAQAGAANAQRQAQYNEAQRVAGRDQYVALQKNVLDNPNNDPNDPALNDIKDPTAKQTEVARRVAARQQATQNIASAYQPHEGGSLVKVLSGLIHGAPAPPNPAIAVASQPPTPPADPNVSASTPPTPVVKDMLGIPISDPAVAAAHQEPMHPMAPSHPILDRFNEGLDALGSHLKAAAAGAHPAQPAYDTSNLAAGYASPISTARETATLQSQHAIALEAERRKRAILTMTPENKFLNQYASDNGAESFADLPSDQQAEGLAAYKKANLGPKLTTAIVIDPDSSTGYSKVSMNQLTGEVGSTIPGVTPPRGFIPTQRASRSTDQYGNVTTSVATVTPQVPGGNAPPIGGNAAPRKGQPVSSAAPTAPIIPGQTPTPPNVIPSAPDLAAINAGIQANKGKAGAPSRKVAAVESPTQPVSNAAPKGPAILDANDQIPASAAPNDQVRQFAQDLLDDRDVAQIPAKARAAAEQVARQFGWSQGAFTPREQRAINLTSDFLNKFADSPSLKVLDDPILRAEAVSALHQASGLVGQQLQAFTSRIEDPRVAEFVRLYNSNVNNVTGASSTIRPGRPTEALVRRLGTELPTVLQAKDSTDAKARIGLLQDAIKDAQKSSRLKGVSPSSSAPQYKVGDKVKLKDGSTVTVTGYDANGKLQVQ
jgi:hypothetical protein